ncbi:MAG: beta-lactamase family protein [Balneolales bacterium]|nr:beta-lactamase family protein [Balneolales bacterium]
MAFILAIALTASCGQSEYQTDSSAHSAEEALMRDLSPAEEQLVNSISEKGVLFLNKEEQLFAYKYAHLSGPVRFLNKSNNPFPLPYAEPQLDPNDIIYMYDSGFRKLDYYLNQFDTAGLLVLKNGQIILEHYGDDMAEDDTWVSFSVTKSLLSVLFGVAIEQGFIESVNDPVSRYLQELAGTVYDDVTIKHLLQMASGVEWNEDYSNPDSDVAQLEHIRSDAELIAFMINRERAAPPGTKFNYNTGETNLAGSVLKAATGMYLTEFAQQTIWDQYGMEHHASWSLMGEQEIEHGGCCLNASLRDFARIGHLAVTEGVTRDGKKLLPEGWMQESTQPSQGNPGYGYLWWLLSDDRYAGSGIFGQHLHINPEMKLVVVMLSAWDEPISSQNSRHRMALITGITDAARNLGGSSCCSVQE